MHVSPSSNPDRQNLKLLRLFSLLSVLAILSGQSSWGDQPSLTPFMLESDVRWTSGPAKGTLSNAKRDAFAEIEIPLGYRLTDMLGARALLKRMKNPIPDGLAGILAPDSGKWWVVLAFSDIGYVKNASKERINEAVILKNIDEKVKLQNRDRKKQGLPPITSVSWEKSPAFDESDYSLEWAVRAETVSGKVINHTLRLLGRHGVLDATAVQASPDPVPLKQLVNNITFKEGQRYADYRKGDKVSIVGLAELIISDADSAENRTMFAASGGSTVLWIGSASVGCVIVTVGILFFNRKRYRRRWRRTHSAGAEHVQGRAALSVAGKDSGPGGNGEGEKVADSSDSQRPRRRRGFNYQKFYSDMIMQVSSRSSKLESPVLNARPFDRRLEAEFMSRYGEAVQNQPVLTVNSELIANQKNFIEEQRRLMQQQTKLIEEKSKLIEEKNQLLARQSEMIESNLL
jgi:uncharacterized membrane-anchored protein